MTITFTKPVSIYPSQDLNGNPIKRLVVSGKMSELGDLPAELFGLKISQSKKAELAGKTLLKYISYKLNDQTPWSSRVPETLTVATPVEDVKTALVSAFASQPDAKFQLTIKLPGKFANIDTAQGRFTLFDFTEYPTDGNPGYFLKAGTEVTVDLTPSTHNGNEYMRVRLSTDKNADDIFARGGRGQVWGGGGAHDDGPSAADYPELDSVAGLVWNV